MKTSELTGTLLDYYVAKAQGFELPLQGSYDYMNLTVYVNTDRMNEYGDLEIEEYRPSSNWTHGGPLVEKYNIALQRRSSPHMGGQDWQARPARKNIMHGNTALIAICRAVVLTEFGDRVQDIQ